MDQLAELEACRICVTCYPLQEMDFIYLFLKNEEFQQELDFIQGEIRQWQLKIEPDDGLPQRICANCFAKFCSVEAFRKECELAQEKLLETLLQDRELNLAPVKQELKGRSPVKQEQQQLLTQTDTPLPLVGGNYAVAVNSSLEADQQVLVPSSSDVVGLSDFPVFDQQFDHYDNPALMDSSATLLDNNLIDPATSHELGEFLPTQNLFTFETAEPPSSGTLPLVETEIPSIMGGIMEVAAGGATNDDKHDLEDILQRSIIPTNATSTSISNNYYKAKATYNNTRTTNAKDKLKNVATIKTEVKEMSQQKQTTLSNKTKKATQPTQPLVRREDNASDNECDESHVNKRLKGLPYTCHYCYCPNAGPIDHLSFADDDTLSQHFFDKHDPNRPYNCPHCQYSYKTKKLRDNHVRVIHETVKNIVPQKCNYCQKILKGAVEIHQYNCQYVGDWECTNCKEKFPNTPLYRFRLHQRQHDRKQFKCRTCDRTFMRKANLEAHERMHKSETKLQWHCGQCNTNFNTDYDLKRHKNQYHTDERPIKCKDCNQGFSSIALLQRHMLQIHSKDSPNTDAVAKLPQPQHLCLKCNLTFATMEGLQRHMNEASINNGQCLPQSLYNFKERRRIQRQGVFPCFLCPKRFHLRSQLDKHLNTHDARLRPFQCEQCYIRCRTVMELKQHVNVTHLNIKAFACDKCGKCFGYKKDLREHMLFHGEINVHCSEEGCDYACKNDKALRDHIRHKHRLLACEYCHEEFTRQKLTVHLRKVHRTEIDVELAGESDNFYKSQILNNNNDITQISFNLLNTQATANVAKSLATTSSSSTSSPPHHATSSSCSGGGGGGQTVTATLASSTSSISRSDTSLSTNNNAHKTKPLSPTSINDPHNQQLENEQQQLQQQQQQLPTIFVTDHNSNNLALNGFVSTSDELNLVSHQGDEANMFLVSTAASTTGSSSPMANDNQQLDQYFMASLMDTEQEIIVS